MFAMRGKYNVARVFLPDETFLDEQTREQIQGFLNHPAMRGKPIAIMPDVHFGKGSCVGFTFPINEYVIPNMVGVDIGCGIYSYNLGKIHVDNGVLKGLDDYIRKTIPSGFSVNSGKDWKLILHETEQLHVNLLGQIEETSNIIENPGGLTRFYEGLGSLGGGNHFIEVGVDNGGNFWLTIHSGSRRFGLEVATYYQNLAKKLGEKFFLGEQFKDAEFLPIEMGGEDYLDAMEVAQDYADINRLLMMQKIIEGYFHDDAFNEERYYKSVHNYISFQDAIIRKGAVQADSGQRVVIPFNMEDGLILGKGRGNPDWNFSAPHGAGRILSRNQAKKVLSLDEARTGMENAGIFTTSLSEATLDEAKGAYKPKELILEMIKETVDVETFVKPVYNFKAK